MTDVHGPYIYPVIERVEGICKDVLAVDPAPFVAIGGSSVEKPFMCHVGELPQNLSVTDPASSTSTAPGGRARGLYRFEYDVTLTMWANRTDLERTSQVLMGWFELVSRAVAADRTLGGLVQHAQPFLSAAWSDRGKTPGTYLVALSAGVRVRQDIDPLDKEE